MQWWPLLTTRMSEYLERVARNDIALRVKIADIMDNASPRRLYRLSPDMVERLSKKYAAAIRFLEDR